MADTPAEPPAPEAVADSAPAATCDVTAEAASSTGAAAVAEVAPGGGEGTAALHCYVWGGVDWEAWDQHRLTLQFPTYFAALNDMRLPIKQVSCGFKHTMIVTTDGRLFGFGSNAKGQLGVDVAFAYTPLPLLEGKAHWAEVACGTGHTVLRSQDGKVFSFGANVFGQLGHTPKTKPSVLTPTRVAGEIEFVKVVQIAAGGDTSYALAEDGTLYAWGSVGFGALGIGTNGERLEKAGKFIYDDAERPVRVAWFTDHGIRVQKVSAGQKHVLVLSTDKKLYTFGHGAYGRLGQGSDAHDKVWPVPLTWYTRREIEVMDIVCGAEHSLCTARMGEHVFVYFWGRPGADKDGVMTPASVDAICGQGVSSLSAGRGMSLATTEAGEVAIWGENTALSNLGLMGTQKNKRTEPKVVEVLADKHVVFTACGGHHMLAFVDPARSKGDPVLAVPQQGREAKAGGFLTAAKIPWEEAVQQFEAKCAAPAPKAGAEGSAATQPPAKKRKGNDGAPKAAAKAAPKAAAKAAAKVAAKAPKGPLKVGTKLKAWFEDCYVEGVVKQKGKGQHRYLVGWAAEGWKDEEVELAPEDHTTDEANPQRWQLL